MKLRQFFNRIDHDRVHQAVQAAEQGTSGRIVVYVSHHKVTDPIADAHRIFRKLHLETDGQRSGLLLFLAPKAQKFAVLGGTALHEKLGQPWWDHLAHAMGAHFKEGRYTEGLIAVLEEAGQALHAHFASERVPREPDDADIVEG